MWKNLIKILWFRKCLASVIEKSSWQIFSNVFYSALFNFCSIWNFHFVEPNFLPSLKLFLPPQCKYISLNIKETISWNEAKKLLRPLCFHEKQPSGTFNVLKLKRVDFRPSNQIDFLFSSRCKMKVKSWSFSGPVANCCVKVCVVILNRN